MPLPVINAQFEVIQRQSNGHWRGRLTLMNSSEHDLKDWQLHVTISQFVGSDVSSGEELFQSGDYYIWAPVDNAPLTAGQPYEFEFGSTRTPLKHVCDAPEGMFITTPIFDGKQQPVIPVTTLPPLLNRDVEIEAEDIDVDVEPATISIIPQPQSLQLGIGRFVLNQQSKFHCEQGFGQAEVELFASQFARASGFSIPVADSGTLVVRKNVNIVNEGYRLTVSSSGIHIEASQAVGVFYALTSLRQLLPTQAFAQQVQTGIDWSIPAVTIEDQPRFAYRGLILDVVRHFHPVEDIKRILDLMAAYKMNQFHWHLTDDEGWRLEIKAYPKLTEIGAWRGLHETLEPQFFSGAGRYGGFYNQEQVKEIVAYAAARHINVIPEIDVPGHARAAIKSYPELLWDSADTSSYTTVQNYHDNVLSPALESTYQFLFKVLDEVVELFPSKVIHLGGDEVPKGVWEKSPACIAKAKELGYANVLELQVYFFHRLQEYLRSKGRVVAGWEEVAEGHRVDNDAIVTSWRGVEAGLSCAQAGYQVIMCPAQYCYLDLTYNSDPYEFGYHWGGTVNTHKAYNYEPICQSLTADAAKRIWGLQAALWSETVIDSARLDYMLFPRLIALAEVAWTQAEHKDWHSFVSRTPALFQRLRYRGIAFREPRSR